MCIDAKGHLVLVEVVYGVEVFKEEVTYQVNIGSLCLIDVSFVNYEEAGIGARFLEIFFGVELEDEVAELECQRLQLLYHARARFEHVTECVLGLALDIGDVFLPLGLHLLENWRWHGQL